MRRPPLREHGSGTGANVGVCALLTSFNRRDRTLACLRALAANARGGLALSAVLVDDGSGDGTASAVRAEFPWVEVLDGNGSLFWCRGMHIAFDTALRRGFHHYLWLNDDTLLLPDALPRLLACEVQLRTRTDSPLIVVGSSADPTTGAHTYGGERLPSRFACLRVECIAPSSVPQPCDTMSGNIVLIPARTARLVGNLDPAYEHAMGDTDYALRARRLGVELWIAPGVQGLCPHNPVEGTYLDRSLQLTDRWLRILDRKGLPWRSWLRFTRCHTSVMWPMYFLWPYLRLLLGSRRSSSSRRIAQH